MATILVNANIYQQRGQFAQAMLIEEGFIQAVGSNEEIRAVAPAGCEVIDAVGRTVIPGFNDSGEVLRGCFAFARKLGLKEYVLLPYHSLGSGKYKKLDRTPPLEGVRVLKAEELAGAAELGAEYGLTVQIGG